MVKILVFKSILKKEARILLQYINSGQRNESENEVQDVTNIITTFVSNIHYTMKHLSDQDLRTLYKNLTTENDQEFYSWVHGKYQDILKEKGCGAEERFLFSALVVRDFYKGSLDNISRGGDYLAFLSKILADKKQGVEYKTRENSFIPEEIVNRTSQLSINIFTSLCQKVKIDNLNLGILRKIFKENLLNTIEDIAKINAPSISDQK